MGAGRRSHSGIDGARLFGLRDKALLGVGGSRVSRLKKIHKDGTWDGSHTRCPMKVPHHTLSSDDLTAFIEDFLIIIFMNILDI
jgi:hypothetical protein